MKSKIHKHQKNVKYFVCEKFSFLILLCLSILSFAQQDINETFGQQKATMFVPLDKSKVSNGL